MDADAERVIVPQLSAGERLLWSGRPRRGVRLTALDAIGIPFSLVWCGFAVFWEVTAVRSHAPGFFLLFGGFFVAMGVYIVCGRFFADAARREKTFYGLTPRRAIIVSGRRGAQVRSIDLGSLGEISFSERPDRSGTITLGAQPWPWGTRARMMSPSLPGAARYLPPAFEMIENVRDVYEQIRRAKAG
jgi:hypothetical protein